MSYTRRSCLLQEVVDGTTQVRFIPEGSSLHSKGYRRAVVPAVVKGYSPTREVPNY